MLQGCATCTHDAISVEVFKIMSIRLTQPQGGNTTPTEFVITSTSSKLVGWDIYAFKDLFLLVACNYFVLL